MQQLFITCTSSESSGRFIHLECARDDLAWEGGGGEGGKYKRQKEADD